MADETRQVMVKFRKPYSRRFTGTDLREYGPFESGDITRLPVANAELLVDLGVAKRVGDR